jgi:hypothetical protein
VLRRDGGRGAEATARLGWRRTWLMIGDCSARGADLSAISPRPDLIKPHPRVALMGPQGPPVPSASLSVDRAALRGRVPPVDYRDNPSCSPKMSPPPNRPGFSPPSTAAGFKLVFDRRRPR